MHKLGILLLLAAPAASADWGITIKDNLGNPLWEVNNPRCDANTEIPPSCNFIVTAKNVSGAPLAAPVLDVKVHLNPGTDPLPTSVKATFFHKPMAPGETRDCAGLMLLYPSPPGEAPKIASIDIKRSAMWLWQSPQEEASRKKIVADAAELERGLKADCAMVYRQTIMKAQRDLTVLETQEIGFCSAEGWFHDSN
jgi:hypothetical protein